MKKKKIKLNLKADQDFAMLVRAEGDIMQQAYQLSVLGSLPDP